MASIHSIPNEILFVIYRNLRVKDKASLARCCRSFYAALDPLLYHQFRNDREVVSWAARNGQAGALKKLYDAGMTDFATLVFKGSQRRGDRHTALHIAAQEGHEPVIELLLGHGANIDAGCSHLFEFEDAEEFRHPVRPQDTDAVHPVFTIPWVDFLRCEWTPLHLAICHGRLGSVKLLMAHGASFCTANRRASVGRHGPTTMAASALHSAAVAGDLSVITAVLDHFSLDDVDVLDDQDLTPLRWAYTRGSMDAVKFLVDRGANINHPKFRRQSILMQACALGRFDDVSGLLELGADAAMTSEHKITALHHLCDQISSLFEAKDPSRPYKLSKARSAMKALLRNGADANTKDTQNGQVPLVTIAEYCQTDMIQLLLDNNADVNAIASNGMTALRAACRAKNYIPTCDMKETVKLLLKHGASVYPKTDGLSGTVLDDLTWNVYRSHSHFEQVEGSLGEVLSVILDHGLKIDPGEERDKLFQLFFALGHVDCCILLRDHGLEPPTPPRQ